MSETIQSASDRDHPREAELPTHAMPAEAQRSAETTS